MSHFCSRLSSSTNHRQTIFGGEPEVVFVHSAVLTKLKLQNHLDIIVADADGMLYSVFPSHLTDFLSVLELIDGLGDPDDIYKGKVKKGVHCDISSVLVFLILMP